MTTQDTSTLPLEISYSDLLAVENTVIIDCRTCAEFETGHISEAINIPLQQLSIRKEDLPCSPEDSIVVYCRTGNRSFSFATYLRSIGFSRCQSIAGGFETWGEAVKC